MACLLLYFLVVVDIFMLYLSDILEIFELS